MQSLSQGVRIWKFEVQSKKKTKRKQQENIISPLGASNTQLSFLALIMEISNQMQTEEEKFSMSKKFQDHYLKIGVKIN